MSWEKRKSVQDVKAPAMECDSHLGERGKPEAPVSHLSPRTHLLMNISKYQQDSDRKRCNKSDRSPPPPALFKSSVWACTYAPVLKGAAEGWVSSSALIKKRHIQKPNANSRAQHGLKLKLQRFPGCVNRFLTLNCCPK